MKNDYTPTEVNEITTVHTQQSYLIDGIEYRSVPKWLVNEHKMLKYVIVSKDARVLYHNMEGFCENENFKQVWATKEVRDCLYHDMDPDQYGFFTNTENMTENGFLWIGENKDGYFISERYGTIRDIVALKKLVAATWLSRYDSQTWICPLDTDKFNIHADNLRWCTQKEYKDYMKEYRKKEKEILSNCLNPVFPAPRENFDLSSIPNSIPIPKPAPKISYTGEHLFDKNVEGKEIIEKPFVFPEDLKYI